MFSLPMKNIFNEYWKQKTFGVAALHLQELEGLELFSILHFQSF